MITFNKVQGQKILELGCGNNRHAQVDVAVDFRQTNCTDFAVDLAKPDWPIGSGEFDAVLSIFCIEHIPYPATRTFIAEAFRVCKPGGRVVIVAPNTEAQLKWILAHPDGWDSKGLFESASCKLFGDQEHGKREGDDNPGVDSHKSYWNPTIAMQLFTEAGFERIVVSPFGERATDMVIDARKPVAIGVLAPYDQKCPQCGKTGYGLDEFLSPYNGKCARCNSGTDVPLTDDEIIEIETQTKPMRTLDSGEAAKVDAAKESIVALVEQVEKTNDAVELALQTGAIVVEAHRLVSEIKEVDSARRAAQFNRQYFDYGGPGYPMGYADFHHHEIIARNVLARQPKSVVECGAGRGYVAKRLVDKGIRCVAMDISRHCELTRVTDEFILGDLCQTWRMRNDSSGSPCGQLDLCLSVAFLEHIPEALLPNVFAEMQRVCRRGLHAISFVANGHDSTQCAIKPRSWWLERMPPNHEILSVDEIKHGQLPSEYFRSAGDQTKINLGSFCTMAAHGWNNLDICDLKAFAQANGYNFQQRDIRNGLIQKTGMVDSCVLHHTLEHFTHAEATSIAKELRRVIKLDGAIRIIVPDMREYVRAYSENRLGDFDEMNGGSAGQATQAGKFHALLYGSDHRMTYDAETLIALLTEAGFVAKQSSFRRAAFDNPNLQTIRRETTEHSYGGTSLFVDAVPLVG